MQKNYPHNIANHHNNTTHTQLLNTKLIQYLILINMIVLLVVAPLNNVHYDPLRTFWGEITFAWAIITLFLLVCFTHRQISIPSIVAPLILFGAYVALQPIIKPIEFIGVSFITALEMMLSVLLAIACNTIIQQYGLKTFVRYLCISLIIGAFLQSAIGFIQYNGWFKYFTGRLSSLIFYDPSHSNSNIFGHFGQRNSYCHYLSWGVFALIYMRLTYNTNKFINYIFIPALIWLIFSMTISSSRSVFIYFIVATIIALFYLIKNRNTDKRQIAQQLFYIILMTLVALIVLGYCFPLIQQLTHKQNVSSGLQRLVEENGAAGIAGRRLFEWKKALIVFKNNPIFGYGISKFPQQSVYLSPLFPKQPSNSGALFIYCHNTILQLMAETGIIGTLIVVLGCAYSIKKIWQQNSLSAIIILCMLATTIAHSLVEYPLWYLYFLGPFIMFMAVTKTKIIISNTKILLLSLVPIVYLVYLMASGTIIAQKVVDYWDIPDDQTTFVAQAKYIENLANNNILWKGEALHTLDDYINVDDVNTDHALSVQMQLYYELKFTNTYPYPSCLLKVAMLYWSTGDQINAIKTINLLIGAYPHYKKWALNELHNKKYIELYKVIKNNKAIK